MTLIEEIANARRDYGIGLIEAKKFVIAKRTKEKLDSLKTLEEKVEFLMSQEYARLQKALDEFDWVKQYPNIEQHDLS